MVVLSKHTVTVESQNYYENVGPLSLTMVSFMLSWRHYYLYLSNRDVSVWTKAPQVNTMTLI